MERGGNRQPLGGDPGYVELGFDRLDGVGRTRQHDLAQTVVVRDDHVGARLLDDLAYCIDRAGDRRHRTGGLCGLGHQHAPLSGDTDQVDLRQGARCVQGGDLAKAVSGDVLRVEPDRVEHAKQSEAGRADRRLRPMRCPEQRLVDVVGAFFERRDRKDHIVERMVVPVLIGREIPGIHGLGEVHREIRAHEQVLAALARKDERDVTRGSPRSVMDAGRCRPRSSWVAVDQCDRLDEFGPEVFLVARRECQAR